MANNIVTLYVFFLEGDGKISVEDIKVKETEKRYCCIGNEQMPFTYNRFVDKTQVGLTAFRSYMSIYYYSLDSSIEGFKEKVNEFLEWEIDKLNKKIKRLQEIGEAANKSFKKQYNI